MLLMVRYKTRSTVLVAWVVIPNSFTFEINKLKAFLRLSVRTSNLLQNIELVRFDEITNRIVVLIGETIQVEILSKWRGDYRMSDY